MDNAGGHKQTSATEAALEKKRISFRFLPPNSTDLCQPADANVIQQLKRVWKEQWEKEKFYLRLAAK
ncbi:hypothetical protein PybrP1_000533 [[Pythium] brassicae (nom. inval.)]|nr:hypothetical protein PybrP1_000533 [[Pythium] brassicae (nom. inval.)]